LFQRDPFEPPCVGSRYSRPTLPMNAHLGWATCAVTAFYERICHHWRNAMPTDNATHRPKPAFYRMRDVIRITSLSRPTLYRRIAAHRFPAPIKLGGRASD